MRLFYVSLALFASLGACLRPALASSSNAIVTDNQISEAFQSDVKMYNALAKLKAFHVEYVVSDASPEHQDPIVVSGDLQKPNKMNLRLYRNKALLGEIISDGVTETIYNVPTNEYINFQAPQPYELKGMLMINLWEMSRGECPEGWEIANALSSQNPLRKPADFGALFLLGTNNSWEIDFSNLHRTSTKVISPSVLSLISLIDALRNDNGKSGTDFSPSKLDPSSHLPTAYVERHHNNVQGHDIEVSLLCFEQMKIQSHSGPFPASAFVWIPPAGASTPSERPFNHKGHDYTEPKFRLIDPAS